MTSFKTFFEIGSTFKHKNLDKEYCNLINFIANFYYKKSYFVKVR
jgi:hypothetical protein